MIMFCRGKETIDGPEAMSTYASSESRRATIWEVAKRAGVSHQTVSRFLHQDTRMRADTKERVGKAIKELNYRPNLTARSMRTRKSGRVAIAIAPITTQGPSRMLVAAMEVAHQAGYSVEVLSIEGSEQERLERVSAIADSGQVEGILALTPLPLEDESLPGRAEILLSPGYDEKLRGVGELIDGSPVAELVEGLAGLGHRKFLHVTGLLEFASARSRRDVFLDTVNRLGHGPGLVHEGWWAPEAGRQAILALPEEEPPTAVITASDNIAGGVIQGARERGWRIPEDLSVTGWDNHLLGGYLWPTLTTVDIDHRMLGRTAMQKLVAVLRHEPEPARPDTPLNTVIWRGSTGPAPTH